MPPSVAFGATAAEDATADGVEPVVEDAYAEGMRAYERGDIDAARDRLTFASDHGYVFAIYYLARLYGSETAGMHDPVKAYRLYKDIADAYQDISRPQFDERAQFISRAIVEVARVLMAGLPAGNINADRERAMRYLEIAAQVFDDRDAQFDLGKAYLDGSDDAGSLRLGMDLLALLAERKAHAGAQAFLGELYWSGSHVDRSPTLSLALLIIARENAGGQDQLWIEDLYQRVFCGTTAAQRKRANELVESWRHKQSLWSLTKEAEKDTAASLDELPALTVVPLVRSCGDGEFLEPLKQLNGRQLPAAGDQIEASGTTEETFELGAAADTDAGVPAQPLDEVPPRRRRCRHRRPAGRRRCRPQGADLRFDRDTARRRQPVTVAIGMTATR